MVGFEHGTLRIQDKRATTAPPNAVIVPLRCYWYLVLFIYIVA